VYLTTESLNFVTKYIDMKYKYFEKLKKAHFLGMLFLMLFVGNSSYAQVASNYIFSQNSMTYEPLSGGTVLGVETNDDTSFPANPIGFTFMYNGVDYTTFSVNSNGFIALGDDIFNAYSPISSGPENVISALGFDIQGLDLTGELSYLTLGTAPNRTLVVEWKNYRPYSNTEANYTFQIRLNETSNSIDVVYGDFTHTTFERFAEIGLKGTGATDFNNRTTASDWAATTPGTDAIATCLLSVDVMPTSGLMFTWTLANCLGANSVSVSNITSSSAFAEWAISDAPVGGFDYELRTSGAAGSGATGLVLSGNTADLSMMLNTLDPATTYYFYVRVDCGLEQSGWSIGVEFTTECEAELAPTVVQDFSTYTGQAPNPVCWTEGQGVLDISSNVQNGFSFWASNTGFANTGNNAAAKINLYNSGQEWLISQAIDLGNSNNFRLKYDMAVTDWLGTASQSTLGTHAVYVVVSLDGGITWSSSNILKTYTGAGSYSNTGQVELIDLSAYSGVVKFAFVTKTQDTSPDLDFHIDNFVVETIPACPEVLGLNTSNITLTSATISWTAAAPAPANGYEYVVSTTNQAPVGNGTATTATSVNLTDLAANTTYYYFVRQLCDASEASPWVSSSFFTGYCTPAPTSTDGLGITNVTMGTINNTTGLEAGGYGNYSNLVTDVQQGANVNVSITYETGYAYETKIWIDWNNDLDFNDADELVYTGVSTEDIPTTLLANFTVPATASLGTHRLRIGGRDEFMGQIDPCSSLSWSVFEDYTINVVESGGCTTTTSTLGVQECAASYTLNNQTYTATGTYTQTITNVAGCDSIITLNLVLNPAIVASVTLDNNTLTASPAGQQYIWFDCTTGMAITGETSQTFIPTADGEYYVLVIGAGNCSDSSSCINFEIRKREYH
jgi:hypothetical protein